MAKKVKKEEETLEIKETTIIDRHTKLNEDGSFKSLNIITALLELEARLKTDRSRLDRLEEGMALFVEWYKENIDKKIILPGSTEFDKYKPL